MVRRVPFCYFLFSLSLASESACYQCWPSSAPCSLDSLNTPLICTLSCRFPLLLPFLHTWITMARSREPDRKRPHHQLTPCPALPHLRCPDGSRGLPTTWSNTIPWALHQHGRAECVVSGFVLGVQSEWHLPIPGSSVSWALCLSPYLYCFASLSLLLNLFESAARVGRKRCGYLSTSWCLPRSARAGQQ